MILTPDNYPFAPYPPFKDPDDWREIDSWADPRDPHKAQVLMGDVELEHLAKHARHDHPWCVRCAIRQTAHECDYGEDYRPVGEDFVVYREVVLRRIARYLTLHNGRPPLDTFDPESTATSLSEELLHRDELANLDGAPPLIEGVLTRHAYAVLRGRDGTYKSFTALDWSLCLATGRPWQGHAAERVKVLYVVGEGAYDLDNRITAWETAWRTKVDPEWFVVLPRAVDLYSGTELDELLGVVDGFGLVVLDTLRRVSGRAEGNGSDMNVVIDNIEKIKRATDDGSVLAVAHTDKGDNDARGFSAIEDDADIVWHAKKVDGFVTLENTKMKSGPDGEKVRLQPTTTGPSVVLHATAETLTGEVETSGAQRAVLEVLATTFAHTEGATTTELIEATGLAKSTFYHARGALLNLGLIESNGPTNRRRYTLTRSNAVQPDPDALTCDVPISPTRSNAPGPVQSSPTPLRGLDVGLRTPGHDDQNTEKESA